MTFPTAAVPLTLSVPVTPMPPLSVPVLGVRLLVPAVKSIASARAVKLPPVRPPEIVPVLVTLRLLPTRPVPPAAVDPPVPPVI